MKKILALLLTLVFTVLACAACGSQNDQPEEAVQTEIRLDACGLAYTIPTSWTGTDNINIITTSYAQPESSIYALVRYDYAPDENMAELNDMESETAVEDLMAPLVELLVVRDGQETADAVEAEMEKFTSCRELPKQEGFRFYYLTDPVRGVAYLPESGIQTYQELAEDLPLLYDSIETFVPDTASVEEQAKKQSSLFGFISSDLDGNAVDSSIFADYDLTVVNFYGSYSYPDINELQELEQFYQELQTEHPNVNFFQVIIDTPSDAAEEKMQQAYAENGVTFMGIMPDMSMASWILKNIEGIPTTIFVDENGYIQDIKLEQTQTADVYMQTTEQVLDQM